MSILRQTIIKPLLQYFTKQLLTTTMAYKNPKYAMLMTIQNTYDNGSLQQKNEHTWKAVDLEWINHEYYPWQKSLLLFYFFNFYYIDWLIKLWRF